MLLVRIPTGGGFFDNLPYNDAIRKAGAARIVTTKYKADPSPQKVDLGAGVYKDESGKPWVFPVVRKVESIMATENPPQHSTDPFENTDFEEEATAFLLGNDSPAITERRVTSVQSVGATGGLRLAAEVCLKSLHLETVYIPEISWTNHRWLFQESGFTVKEYRYWDTIHNKLDIHGLLQDLKNTGPGCCVLFHACSHNPTGTDPTLAEWRQIARLCETLGLFVIFDCAYQGFLTGDHEYDAQPVRQFVDSGLEFFVASCFSKNFGLYNERVGNLCLITRNIGGNGVDNIRAHLVTTAEGLGLIPSNHGAAIVARVLKDPALREEWRGNLRTAASRIEEMRSSLYNKLNSLQTPGNWDCLKKQKGMFALLSLTPPQIHCLTEMYHIYMMANGRICLAGLNRENVDYVADAIHYVVENVCEDSKL